MKDEQSSDIEMSEEEESGEASGEKEGQEEKEAEVIPSNQISFSLLFFFCFLFIR